MRDVVDMLADKLAALTDECMKEVLEKFPMLLDKRETVTDWTTYKPWGGTLHQIAIANTPIARFEVGCRATENPMMYRLYRIGPSFFVEPEDVERLLREI